MFHASTSGLFRSSSFAKEEWRELLTALAESLRVSLKIYPARVLSGEEERQIVEAMEVGRGVRHNSE